MPKVSIIVPNYNHEKFLKGRLDSIVHQTFTDFELIILDDHSSDDSVSIISTYQTQYPNLIRFVPSTKNSGSPFKQWDRGIALAKGELIWIAESDDLSSISFLEYSVPFFERNENLGMVVVKSNAIDATGGQISEFHPMFNGYESKLFKATSSGLNYFNGDEFVKDYLAYKCLIPNVSGTLFRKSAYLNAGGLNLNFKRNGDYDLYFRMLYQSDIGFLNKSLNSTRYHDDKLTASNNAQSFKEVSTILKPVFDKLKLSASKRLEIMSFYFTVYKYDIFLNDAFTFKEKVTIFQNLSNLSGLLHFKFLKLLLQRGRINLSKIIKS
ncbi:glycosyltransferase family 2 protein [Gelidibacter salicanalis]|uniref:Glycosyltransferase n=1 Tax=Gelidibacter salicanalis TaxID=291193 RepID=A0A934KR85_9FLAO|nr:glycosyltransferase family 2 protein [Gelidibacter salicanalis]MBJ7879168.1 glycosyltransferase [Gelidibacter salicanalis]